MNTAQPPAAPAPVPTPAPPLLLRLVCDPHAALGEPHPAPQWHTHVLSGTALRLALLGMYWKLRAHLARQRGEAADAALPEMTQAYRRALEESITRSGAADYEIIFNALAGAFLLKARGQDRDWRAMQPDLAGLLRDAIANVHLRYGEQRKAVDVRVEVQGAQALPLQFLLEMRPDTANGGSEALLRTSLRAFVAQLPALPPALHA